MGKNVKATTGETQRFVKDLDATLLQLSPYDAFTLRDACAGVHAFGGIGSGKTTGTGQAIASAYLRAGMGAVWLCVKPEEVARALALAKANGRADSVIVFDETQGFNFIDYELAKHGTAGVGNVVESLMRVLASADQTTGVTGQTGDAFWEHATRQMLHYILPALYGAWGNVTIRSIVDFAASAATKSEHYADEAWCGNSLAARSLQKLSDNAVVPMDDHGQRTLLDYWFRQFPAIPEKTRGNIVTTLSAKLDRFNHGRLQQAFCGKTTIVPEMTFHGAIIVMAMPALTWHEDGVIGQKLFKYFWQRAMESRNGLDPRHQERAVFIFSDESQYFVDVKDDEFLSTCRASRACVVFMTQTLPTYYAKLGKDKQDAVDGLVGKFATQVFHANACSRTNQFAAQLIGRGLHRRASGSESEGHSSNYGMNQGGGSSSGTSFNSGSSHSDMGGGSRSSGWGRSSTHSTSWGENISRGTSQNRTQGWSEQMDYLIEPNFFTYGLRTGGKPHKGIVTGLWFKAGASFASADGNNHMVVAFKQ